jgi:glycosyltransferase involved in cell wall biosynthesis
VRVLIVHQPTGGGVGRHVSDLARGLAERDCEAILCGPALPDGLSEVPHEPLDLRRAIDPRADPSALYRFIEILRRVRPDIVHAHSSKAGAVARLGRLAQMQTPVVYTPHGYAFAGYFSRPVERLGYREVEHALSRLATRVVCVCEAEGRLAARIGPKERIRVIHNGIELPGECPVDPDMSRLRDAGPVICALTELRPGKGIETLIDATPSLRALHPHAQIAVWGEGPELASLRSRARQVGAAEAVHFLGPSSAPLSALRGADVFVHPSWAESFPYVILEAMAVGLPIVASDVGGVGEALVDGESGLLVPAGDRDALTRALIDLLDDAGRRARMGDAGKRRVERCFSRSTMIDRLLEVYSEASG